MGTTKAIEVEAKFAVAGDIDVPDLTAVYGVDDDASCTIHNLSAIYYDTDDLSLTDNRVVLRRRTGGTDAGWHVKFPAATGRLEIRCPLDETDAPGQQVCPPEEILSQLTALLRGRNVTAIARVDNERHVHSLVDANGEPVAEFCDDHVTAWSFLPGGQRTMWREWEFELHDTVSVSDRAGQMMISAAAVLKGAGATDSDFPSKLVAALGESVANIDRPAPFSTGDGSPLAGVVAAIAADRDKMVAWDPAVRRDEDDSVHQMRVATRQMRSHLSTFAGILDPAATAPVEKELKHLARILGRARDAEVVAEILDGLFEKETDTVIDPGLRDFIVGGVRDDYSQALAGAVDFMSSARYIDLLNAINDLVTNPPLATPTHTARKAVDSDSDSGSQKGGGKAGKSSRRKDDRDTARVLAAHLSETFAELDRARAVAHREFNDRSIPLTQREEHIHDMRKIAKKLRYAVEAAGSSSRLDTGKLYRKLSDLQDDLGAFQDSVTVREILADKAAAAHARGHNTFPLGIIHEKLRAEGHAHLSRLDEKWEKVDKAYRKMIRKAR